MNSPIPNNRIRVVRKETPINAVSAKPKHNPETKGARPTIHSTSPEKRRPTSGSHHGKPRPSQGSKRYITNNPRKGLSSGGKHMRRLKSNKPTTLRRPESNANLISHIPPLASGNIRIIPICGVEWVGTNMTAVEYKDEIIVIDAGFAFGNPDTPGINYTIPDIAYLEANKHKIKAMVVTHGHLDHVGAIPYVIDKLGNPPIYTREFGAIFVQKRMEEFPHLPKLNIITVTKDDGFLPVSGNFKVKFFGLTHSIPDATGVVIRTPIGSIVNTGDVRVENHDGVPVQKEYDQYKFFKDENVLLLAMDSTGAIKPGWSESEQVVKENIDKVIRNATGRLFIATFSSQVERIISFIESAKKCGKYVAIEGRSMKSNVAIVEQLKLTDLSHQISIKELDDYPPNKVVVILTGAQGEEFAALNRMANETHNDLRLNPKDTIVLSSSVIPGNEHPIDKMKDNLYRGSYNILTYQDNQVHASGHGKRDELMWIHSQIPYKFFMPVHGRHEMLKVHATLAREIGVPDENIVVPDNGSIIEIQENGTKLVKLKEKAPARQIVMDGKMLGEIPEVVMKDRKLLGESGIFVVVVSVDIKTGKLRKSPDLISRGFIYLRENQQLLQRARSLVKRTVEDQTIGKGPINFDNIKGRMADTLEKFLFQETGKEPIVIPVVLGL